MLEKLGDRISLQLIRRELVKSLILQLLEIEKEKEKIEKYQDLRTELQKIWNVRVKIIQLVVGSLGAITKHFGRKTV